MGGSSAAMGVVGGVAGAAHQATVTTVDQTQIITLQAGYVLRSQYHQMFLMLSLLLLLINFFIVIRW